MLERTVTIRVLYLCLLAALALGVLTAWSSTRFANGKSNSQIAVLSYQVSQYPEKVSLTFQELRRLLSADGQEHFFRLVAENDALGADYVPLNEGLVLRVDRDRAAPGWRYIAGAFRINGTATNAVALLNPNFELAAVWPVDEAHVRARLDDTSVLEPPARKVIHGMDILDDGGFAFTFDHGHSLQRMSVCDGIIWSRAGNFHHSVSFTDGTIWTLLKGGYVTVGETGEDTSWGQSGMVRIDPETGETLHAISIDQIRAANPDISIFDIPRRTDHGPTVNWHTFGAQYMPDPYHLNDVDPLPAALVNAFPGFEAGDLMISARTLNTVFVVRPETREVVWRSVGNTRRQHDPDWGQDGTITVFDNRMGMDFSEIVALDPASQARTVLHDGEVNDFYTYVRGKHDVLDNGHIAVVSSQQGRVFEVDPATGDTVFELYSTHPDEPGTNYVLTSLEWLPPDTFTEDTFSCASSN